ncbi:50S ribosomal protein L21 [Maricaulis sp.]|uniref:50S ribosomal protein L21 n=1 Tax=Maricaulis sp. TaxID=1486257 RepID=UPI001B0F04E0|nr:50S ribosomal protein L21 [Maricaulis sp.]MBO6795933.1 50S ribosomal protein L21 [Maricaulis sp.]
MFAVIKTGGKQYRVATGDEIRVEKLEGQAGDTLDMGDVLMLGGEEGVTVGAPTVEGAQVIGEVLVTDRDRKIIVFKKRRRQNYRRTKGHRQWGTTVRIAEIVAPGSKAKTKLKTTTAAPVVEDAKTEAPKAKAAPKKAEAKKAAAPKKEAAAPAANDDLTQLTGVGPALAKKLNEAGVTSFAQIAAWTDADMEALGVTAKAEKGDWIAAAKALAAK